MANTINAYDRISDVDVVMTIVRPKATVGLGNLLILNLTSQSAPSGGGNNGGNTSPQDDVPSDQLTPQEMLDGLLLRKTDAKTGAMYREYRSLEAVKTNYSDNPDVLAKAETYFAQENHSDRVAILDIPSGKEQDALGAFWFFNWTFAALAKSNDDLPLLTKLSNIFEANKDHLLVIQTNDISVLVNLQGQNYTFAVKHNADEKMDVALVGKVATKPVGSQTWKFKDLQGITPENLTATELKGINKVNAIAYTTVGGQGETTEGKTLSGEYIDTIHGIIWVKTEMGSRLEKLLQDNDKISYDQNGINMFLATATQVMNQAYEQGIVQTTAQGKPDFTVTALPREQQSVQNLSDRQYDGLRFSYHASGAVHSLTVQGTVNSDTLL